MSLNERDFMWLYEAAHFLNINRRTLIGWLKKDQMIKNKNPSELSSTERKFRCPPYGRIGNRYRFRKEDLEKFIEESMKSQEKK